MRNIKRKVANVIKAIIAMLHGKNISYCNADMVNGIVSFDVFDTLICRSVKDPTDVFDMICPDITDFKGKRINAEKKARQICGKEDCTLSEIYAQFSDFSVEQKAVMQQKEIEAECEACYANSEMLDYFNKCRDAKKRIIIVSDMYLSSDTIKIILTQNGYNLDGIKMYVSSEAGVTKRSGNLYKHIIKEESTSDILHIGDNSIADYYMAKKSGIDAFLYVANKNKCVKKKMIKILQDPLLICVLGVILGFFLDRITVYIEKKPYIELAKANDLYYAGDYDRAYKLYKELDKKGIYAAQSNLGLLYEHGFGVNIDEEKAFDYYLKAYANGRGSRKAIGNYILLSVRRGINRDKLVEIFEKAYDNNDFELLSCAVSCIEAKSVTAKEIEETNKYDDIIERIDIYFPKEKLDKLYWKTQVITTNLPLNTIETDNCFRRYIRHSSSAKKSIYVYEEGVKNEKKWDKFIRTGLAEYGE